ncbi:MAG: N-acetylmuramoyl-L-alanine amidase family protein [Cellulosilyticaceae bacterium]
MKIEKGILKDVNIYGVKFVVDIIPKGRKRRSGIAMSPQYVTIHNTGCDNVPADNFRRSQLDPSQDKEVSWHFTVDEKTIIQHLPITEVAWHAGHRNGNYTSFGIETCERTGSEEVLILFVAELLKALAWSTNNVRSHKSWSGKQCPALILPHWELFIAKIKMAMAPKPTVSKDEDLEKAVEKLMLKGTIGNPSVWNSLDKINLKNVPSLLCKMGGVDKLYQNKVISNKLLWETGEYNTNHVRSLIIKYARYLG